MDTCIIIGAGGHAKVVIDAIVLQGQYKPVAITDSDPKRRGSSVMGIPVVGGDEQLPELLGKSIKHVAIGVGSVKDNLARKRLFDMAVGYGFIPVIVVHPDAVIAASVVIGRGSVVLAGAIVNPDARIGENVVVNTGAIIEHDCEVQSHAHICSGVRLSGGVIVKEGVFVGSGSVVKQHIRIGEWATIGMGSIVVRAVEPHSSITAVPARKSKMRTVL